MILMILCDHLLSPLRSLRRGQLDLIPGQPRVHSRWHPIRKNSSLIATPHIRNIFNDLTKRLISWNWVWFSVDVNLTSHMKGRMSLLITIFLVLINIYNTIQTNSPQVWGSYQILNEEGGSWGSTRGVPFNSNIFLWKVAKEYLPASP